MTDSVKSERDELDGFLDWFRLVASNKVRGLDLDEATRVTTPSGMSLLGVIRHLTWVERFWFRTNFMGDEPEGVDQPSSFLLGPDDTPESVLAAYDDACATSRAIAASAATLDATSARPHHYFGHVTMRWVLIHMIEETARHAGHLDILRELTDGQAGD